MGITYFNWSELLRKSNKDRAAIIILAYAQCSVYNEYTPKTLMSRLNIHHIPTHLFTSKTLKQHKHFLECTYKTIEPQSYYKDYRFLTASVSILYKIEYLKLLSLRRISDKTNRISKELVSSVSDNPFIKQDDNYIYLNY